MYNNTIQTCAKMFVHFSHEKGTIRDILRKNYGKCRCQTNFIRLFFEFVGRIVSKKKRNSELDG